MAVHRHRILRGFLFIWELVQFFLYLLYPYGNGKNSNIADASKYSFDFSLLVILLALQIICIVLVYPIIRTYDFRPPETRSCMEMVLNAPAVITNGANKETFYSPKLMWCFHIAQIVDFLIRLLRLVFIFSWCLPIVAAFNFVENIFYLAGSFSYTLMLLSDQDYLRNVMSALDQLTGRKRKTVSLILLFLVYDCCFTVDYVGVSRCIWMWLSADSVAWYDVYDHINHLCSVYYSPIQHLSLGDLILLRRLCRSSRR